MNSHTQNPSSTCSATVHVLHPDFYKLNPKTQRVVPKALTPEIVEAYLKEHDLIAIPRTILGLSAAVLREALDEPHPIGLCIARLEAKRAYEALR
jgi:hypothetical protein